MSNTDIICGTEAQITAIRRAQSLYILLRDDPRYTFQGRTVSVVCDAPDTAELVINLARLQGYASAQFASRDFGRKLQERYQTAGLIPVEWEQFWGGGSALEASRAFLTSYQPPDLVTLHEVSRESSDETIRAICECSLASGVTPAPGSVMRGGGPSGVVLYATDRNEQVIATGGGFMAYHPDSAYASEAFWGALATSDSWRGNRLACWLGAQLVVHLNARFGATGFSSGVKADNPSSQAMCARLGITKSDYIYAGATNPEIMGSSPITR